MWRFAKHQASEFVAPPIESEVQILLLLITACACKSGYNKRIFLKLSKMQRASDKIWQCLEPVVSSLGYEFVGAQFGQAENGNTLRVFIDKESGILLDDCAVVSQQLSAVLDVEEPIQTQYVLEVSSPGIERPLFELADFERFLGQEVKIRTYDLIMGRRNFRGTLEKTDGTEVFVEVDKELYAIPVDGIEQAKLLPDFQAR